MRARLRRHDRPPTCSPRAAGSITRGGRCRDDRDRVARSMNGSREKRAASRDLMAHRGRSRTPETASDQRVLQDGQVRGAPISTWETCLSEAAPQLSPKSVEARRGMRTLNGAGEPGGVVIQKTRGIGALRPWRVGWRSAHDRTTDIGRRDGAFPRGHEPDSRSAGSSHVPSLREVPARTGRRMFGGALAVRFVRQLLAGGPWAAARRRSDHVPWLFDEAPPRVSRPAGS
jgi:hypothetical protein